jgi:lipopolysaccharide/colanic/teichoic acid biosynthesis glycosyltransferase
VISDEFQQMSLETEPAPPLRVLPSEDQGAHAVAQPQGAYFNLVKPVIDRSGAAILLILSAPLMAGIGAAVAVGVGRPIIFRQPRVGRNGKVFTVYKFCTMAEDRRSEELPIDWEDRRLCHKSEDDPRLKPLGRVLRRWSLDELPQLWNVVRGDMSLVGPRPELPNIVSSFAPWQHQRHAVKPGLTGYWQVYARGDGTVMHERTDLDVAYVRDVSLRTDLKILLLTLPAVVGLKRGY